MIAVDPSALVAILLKESDADRYIQIIAKHTTIYLSAGSYVELYAVLNHRRDPLILQDADDLLDEADIKIHPVTAKQAMIARRAYTTYSILNYGDSFSYALAMDLDIPLLFKGDDFHATDITIAHPATGG